MTTFAPSSISSTESSTDLPDTDLDSGNDFGFSLDSAESVADALHRWSDSLLDLTITNPLVHLPDTGCVIWTGVNEAFELLASRRKSLTFWDSMNKSLDRSVLRETGSQGCRSAQFKTLRHLHLQAQSLLEGQDISILHVAFGTLTWRANADSPTYCAPLLLLPVTLEKVEGAPGYRLTRLEGEDSELNPILRLQLKAAGFDDLLPNPPEESYLVPSAYLRTVADRVAARPDDCAEWVVEERCCLGRFPLLKVRLYEDLTQQADRAAQHPLVAALGGSRDTLFEMPIGEPEASEVAGSDQAVYRLLDADPAQERAIAAAARGESFVLHGPPGTGKTQTITNIVGERLAAGKTVLLVSGRMASLDAVHRRLADRGLGDLCLVAHSLRTTKRDVLGQLEAGLSSPRVARASALKAAEAAEWTSLRENLDAIARELHQVRQPLGLSVYEAAGIVAGARRANTPAVAARFPLALTSTFADYHRCEEAVRQLAVASTDENMEAAAIPDGQSERWVGAFREPERADLTTAAQIALEKAQEAVTRLEEAAKTTASAIGLPTPPRSLAEIEPLRRVADAFLSLPAAFADSSLLTDADQTPQALHAAATAARQAGAMIARAHASEQVLAEAYATDALLALSLDDLHRRLTDPAHDEVLTPVLGKNWRESADTDALIANLASLSEAARTVETALENLAQTCGIPMDNTITGRNTLLRIARLAVQTPKAPPGWFAPGEATRLRTEADTAELQYRRLAEQSERLLSVYTESILDLDHDALLSTLGVNASGVVRLFNPAVVRDTRVVRAALRADINVKERDIAADLALARDVKALRDAVMDAEAKYTQLFGIHFKKTETDWTALRAMLGRIDALLSELPERKAPGALMVLIGKGGEDLEKVNRELDEITEGFQELKSGWDLLLNQTPPEGRSALPSPIGALSVLAEGCSILLYALYAFIDARVTISGTLRMDAPPRTTAQQAADLDAARVALAARSEAKAFIDALSVPAPADGDWEALASSLDGAAKLRAAFPDKIVPAAIAEKAQSAEFRALVADSDAPLVGANDALYARLADLDALFTETFLQPIRPIDTPFHTLNEWLVAQWEATVYIDAGQKLQSSQAKYDAQGLGDFTRAMAQARQHGDAWAADADATAAVFHAAFHRAWLDETLAVTPALAGFRGEEQAARIERFRLLDRRQMETVPGRVRESLRSVVRTPKDYPTEVKILKERLARRRAGEVRKLLAQIPSLLPALKPCVLMNPLSVRVYLDPEALGFDTVIFDDASQIATEDALGAILRGKQVIIAGDRHQIPPLALIRDAGHTGPLFESILDAATELAQDPEGDSLPGFGYYPLHWHYRSKHESLIAFSRRFFYPDLLAFPAAESASCVEHHAITVEAPASATEGEEETTEAPNAGIRASLDTLIAYSEAHPEESLGVICLTESDYAAFLDEMAARRADTEKHLPAAFAPDAVEPLFIKTVENVQGDERDAVLLYLANMDACDALREEGGERLLNVATTRARRRLLVADAIGELPPPEANGAAGHALLRAFLTYARGSQEEFAASPVQDAETASTLESLIADTLVAQGCEVRHQVGTTDYRVDLAVVDPKNPGRYSLGVVCDGPIWADSPSARHRDRLRNEMLTERGWNLHRACALDWANDPENAGKSLVAALKKAAA